MASYTHTHTTPHHTPHPPIVLGWLMCARFPLTSCPNFTTLGKGWSILNSNFGFLMSTA